MKRNRLSMSLRSRMLSSGGQLQVGRIVRPGDVLIPQQRVVEYGDLEISDESNSSNKGVRTCLVEPCGAES